MDIIENNGQLISYGRSRLIFTNWLTSVLAVIMFFCSLNLLIIVRDERPVDSTALYDTANLLRMTISLLLINITFTVMLVFSFRFIFQASESSILPIIEEEADLIKVTLEDIKLKINRKHSSNREVPQELQEQIKMFCENASETASHVQSIKSKVELIVTKIDRELTSIETEVPVESLEKDFADLKL